VATPVRPKDLFELVNIVRGDARWGVSCRRGKDNLVREKGAWGKNLLKGDQGVDARSQAQARAGPKIGKSDKQKKADKPLVALPQEGRGTHNLVRGVGVHGSWMDKARIPGGIWEGGKNSGNKREVGRRRRAASLYRGGMCKDR